MLYPGGGIPSRGIFAWSLFAYEVSTVATVICGFANTITLLKVKFKLRQYILVMRLLVLVLDSPRESLMFFMDTVRAQPTIPAAASQSCP